MVSMLGLLIAVIIAALIFDYINGFHDAANAIATVVSTGVLPVRTAVILAGILNFAGAMTGTAVAKTIASGFAEAVIVTQVVVLAALIGASIWNLLTWWYGIPSSSSHALIGGLAGAVVAHAGLSAFNWDNLVGKVLIPLVVSPTLGFTAAFLVMIGLLWITRRARPDRVQRGARRLQLVSACMMAFSHGSNDAQKSMGIITLALISFAASGGEGMPVVEVVSAVAAVHASGRPHLGLCAQNVVFTLPADRMSVPAISSLCSNTFPDSSVRSTSRDHRPSGRRATCRTVCRVRT